MDYCIFKLSLGDSSHSTTMADVQAKAGWILLISDAQEFSRSWIKGKGFSRSWIKGKGGR